MQEPEPSEGKENSRGRSEPRDGVVVWSHRCRVRAPRLGRERRTIKGDRNGGASGSRRAKGASSAGARVKGGRSKPGAHDVAQSRGVQDAGAVGAEGVGSKSMDGAGCGHHRGRVREAPGGKG